MHAVRLQLSEHLVAEALGDGRTLVWHALLNGPRVLAAGTYELLRAFQHGAGVDDVSSAFAGDLDGVVKELISLGFLVEPHVDERKILRERQQDFLTSVSTGGKFDRLELAITDACNLGCAHCMHFKNAGISNSGSSALHMSEAAAREAIDAFVYEARGRGWREIRVHFGNGEPLLNWNVISFCVRYCESFPEIRFRFAMNSNLIPLTRERAIFLRDHHVDIATSLDGPREANDAIRVDRSGHGTFDKIVQRMEMLQKIGHPISGFTVTITRYNFDQIDEGLISLAKTLGVSDIAVDFDLVGDFALNVNDCISLVMRLRRRSKTVGIRLYGTWETPYRNIMERSWRTQPYSFCPAMEGRTLEVGIDGSLKTCGHTRTRVGHVRRLADVFEAGSPFADLIASRVAGGDTYCRGCEIEAACGGQCQVTREAMVDPRPMCDLLRGVTRALLRLQATETAQTDREAETDG